MPLPAHLERYDALLDMIVEALVRDTQGGVGGEGLAPRATPSVTTPTASISSTLTGALDPCELYSSRARRGKKTLTS
jgi:hypothetical protein